MKLGRSVCAILAAGIVTAFSLMPLSVSAEMADTAPDWMGGEPAYHTISEPSDMRKCQIEIRLIRPILPRIYSLESGENGYIQEVCVYKSKGYQYARYQRDFFTDASRQTTLPERGVAFSIDDGAMIPSQSLGNENSVEQLYTGPQRSEFIDVSPNNRYGDAVRVYRDLPTLIKQTPFGSELILPVVADYTLENSAGMLISTKGVAVSDNGRWLTFMIANIGFVRLDLNDFSVLRISDYFPYSYPEPTVETSISDDGKIAVAGGYYAPFEVIQVDSSCGRIDDIFSIELPGSLGDNACKKKNLWSLIDKFSPEHYGYRWLSMDPTGKSFKYFDHVKWAAISAPAPRLDYLALGDSYASGEGDVSFDGTSHYIHGTNIYGNYSDNIPREVCHISDRAYPALFATDLSQASEASMQSVACSGAIIGDIYSDDESKGYVNANYLGQSTQLPKRLGNIFGPRLTGIEDAKLFQNEALLKFSPGRIQQIEFVKATRPKIVTIMVGGNDLGFGEMMTSCLLNFDKHRMFNTDCYYSTAHGKTVIADRIAGKYNEFVRLYSGLRSASPESKIYVVGYPQFMNSTSSSCVEYANMYTQGERRAIEQFISYANAVLRSAASAAGVTYVDISGSLLNHSSCGSGTGMTGVSDLAFFGAYTAAMRGINFEKTFLQNGGLLGGSLANDVFLRLYFANRIGRVASAWNESPHAVIQGVSQQLLHPNSIGHKLMHEWMTNALGSESLRSNVCNDIVVCPEARQAKPLASHYITGLFSGERVVVGYGVDINQPLGYDPNVKVPVPTILKGKDIVLNYEASAVVGDIDVTLHSTPVRLGAMISMANGIFELKTQIPNEIPVGSHVIHLKYKTAEGMLHDVAQEVYIEGEIGDIDDDGIEDTSDLCAFATPFSFSIDGDRISDNCDIDINSNGVEIAPSPSNAQVSGASAISTNASRNREGGDNIDSKYGSISENNLHMEQGAVLSAVADEEKSEPRIISWDMRYLFAITSLFAIYCFIRFARH